MITSIINSRWLPQVFLLSLAVIALAVQLLAAKFRKP